MGSRRFSLRLLKKELCHLIGSRAWLTQAILTSLLVAYGFDQAVSLYGEASRSALKHPELAPGMNPLDGVLVPTFGSLYLATTLLFPFVAIRPIATELQSGAWKLLLQTPYSSARVISTKAVAAFCAWALTLAPLILAITYWWANGGHVPPGETLNLSVGHALYAVCILGIAFLAAAISDSFSTAAILVLGFTLGSWVLDFAATSQAHGWMKTLSGLSLTKGVRGFERGLFSSLETMKFLALATVAVVVAHGLIGRARRCWKPLATIIPILAAAWMLPFYRDLSEDRRNSLPASDEHALRSMKDELKIEVNLTPDDPRYRDLERQLFSKFRRLLPRVQITLKDTGKSDLFGIGGDERYGMNRYEYRGRAEESRSTSPREILPLIHRLAGNEVRSEGPLGYSGYPLVLEAGGRPFFLFLLSTIFSTAVWWVCFTRPFSRRSR